MVIMDFGTNGCHDNISKFLVFWSSSISKCVYLWFSGICLCPFPSLRSGKREPMSDVPISIVTIYVIPSLPVVPKCALARVPRSSVISCCSYICCLVSPSFSSERRAGVVREIQVPLWEPKPRLLLSRAKLNPVYPMLHKQRGLPRAASIAR